uniref:Uncharacterized protein n=1 Tax=Anguilla anguilla TaxID=7936 RepID=A0A0E9W7Y3_ANGAN
MCCELPRQTLPEPTGTKTKRKKKTDHTGFIHNFHNFKTFPHLRCPESIKHISSKVKSLRLGWFRASESHAKSHSIRITSGKSKKKKNG